MNSPNGVKRPVNATGNESSREDLLGDSEFFPVVVAASIALVVILIVAIAVVGGTGKDLIPQNKTSHPLSQVVMYQSETVA
ncbi:MAG: hypothetical protein JSS95_00250 [Acidobacteria bacterium]|nr:hypothetical protein [Acidobacteriota bacterium]